MVRLGYLRQTTEKFSVLELTPEGRAVLTKRQHGDPHSDPSPRRKPRRRRTGDISCDELLFEKLRQLRKQLADERDVPAYIIFSDVALRQMARDYPASESEFARISGVGEKKLREFGAQFLAEIAAHLASNPRQIFAEDSFETPAAARPRMNDTTRATLQAFRAGETVPQIAQRRELTTGTIHGHLAAAMEAGEQIDLDRVLAKEQQREIEAAFAKTGPANLGGAKELLGDKIDYGQLRIYRLARSLQGKN